VILGTTTGPLRLARIAIVLAALVVSGVVCSAVLTSQAMGYEEPNDLGGTGACNGCHYAHGPGVLPDQPCADCHGDEPGGAAEGYDQGNFQGPHGGYTTGTTKCSNCHTVHMAASNLVLLPEPTIVATCFSCHDGTGGWGVYGTIEARTGSAPGGGHSYEQTSAIPGGDGTTGGTSTRAFKGPGGTLICTDCHSPHGADTVAAFKGDRRRLRYDHPSITSDRILKREPTGATTATAEYGSDWCASCHNGRTSGGMVMNHPVDSSLETSTPFTYRNVAVLASEDPTSATIMSSLGGIYAPGGTFAHDWPADVDPTGNRGYLMPYPRTTEQAGHAPICQQCHEDSRDVGSLVGDGDIGDATPTLVAKGDGVDWDSGPSTWTASPTDNPYFQNFPHETQNDFMLVEQDDDLCFNCHPVSVLP
jgi:predicted CXXCH cytochrome family protein